tara:strand:- start:1309 stop:2205 length:897 start_codon:yes stop_codon:yes gene_type:complete
MFDLNKNYNYLAKAIKPLYQLARLDKPIGFLLLMWPCLWSYVYGSIIFSYNIEIKYIIYFILGSVLMRGAGCTWNDLLDRKYDSKVKRTKDRPLASNKISLANAAIFLVFQLLLSLLILIQFNKLTIIVGLLSIIPIIIYPLMKRITWWPQLFLGITFNWGAIMGWTAITGELSYHCIILYFGCIFWTIGYDTIYAHQDKIDDNFLGLKSTAILFGSKTKFALYFFYLIFITTLIITINIIEIENLYINSLFLFFIFIHLFSQIFFLNIDSPDNCLKIFKSNNSLGIIIFMLLLSNYY